MGIKYSIGVKVVMKNKKIVSIMVFIALFFCQNGIMELTAQSNSIDYKRTYLDLLNYNKLDELFIHLQKWEMTENGNPEMYIAWFNYYIRLGSSSGIVMGKMNDGRYGIYDQTNYLKENVYKGIEYLDKGLKNNKNRLDIYFGKISILNKINDYQKAGEEVIKILQLSKEIGNAWLWSDNVNVDDGERVFINSLGDYYSVWINAGTEISLDQVKICSMKQIGLYPQYIETYNYLSIYYLINKDYNNAIQYLEKALTINRSDCIILINLGRAYMAIENNTKAKECFTKVLSVGNDEDRKYAQSYLDKL
jgi:tetratricopeptide (TPR) repeat protein